MRLTTRSDEGDGLYLGHEPVDAGNIKLVNVMEACKAVLDGPKCDGWKDEAPHLGMTQTQYRKVIYQSGYLICTMNELNLE